MIGQKQISDQITEIIPQMIRGKFILCYPATWEAANQTGQVWVAIGDTPQVQRGIPMEPGSIIVLDELSAIYQMPAVSAIMSSGSAWLTWAAPKARAV